MKRLIFYSLYLLSMVLLLNCSCHQEVVDCMCNDNEVCINSECILDEWVHEIGGTRVIARNSYIGITSTNDCIDTLVFYNDTTRLLNDGQFGLIVADDQGGVQNVAGSLPTFVSDSEFYLYTSAPLCYLNGEARYANMHFILGLDTVSMDFKFWTLGSEPGVFVDSCTVIFLKKD